MLKVKALGSKGFYPRGFDWCPFWVHTAFIAWPHPLCVCVPDLDPEDLTVHSCAFPNPRCPAVCHALTQMSSSLTCFQVEVFPIWSQITSSTIIKWSLMIQTHTCIQDTYCFVFFNAQNTLFSPFDNITVNSQKGTTVNAKCKYVSLLTKTHDLILSYGIIHYISVTWTEYPYSARSLYHIPLSYSIRCPVNWPNESKNLPCAHWVIREVPHQPMLKAFTTAKWESPKIWRSLEGIRMCCLKRVKFFVFCCYYCHASLTFRLSHR